MTRTKKLILGGVAAVAVAIGGLGGAAAFATSTSGGIANGVQSDGSIIQCVQQTDNHNAAPKNNVSCPTGWAQIHPAGASQIAALKAQIAAITAAPGVKGDPGTNGTNGTNGKDGKDGTNAQALPYGIALVNVSRGGKAATTWATYSTTIGSPVGDTTSGTFRMTCSAANAPCAISVQAYATTSGVKVYPRVDISKQDYNSGAPLGNCEYGDGTDNNGSSSAALSTDASSPTAVTLGIGGTLDCGSAQTYPTNGIATEIDVPAGFYDIAFTGTFKK